MTKVLISTLEAAIEDLILATDEDEHYEFYKCIMALHRVNQIDKKYQNGRLMFALDDIQDLLACVIKDRKYIP